MEDVGPCRCVTVTVLDHKPISKAPKDTQSQSASLQHESDADERGGMSAQGHADEFCRVLSLIQALTGSSEAPTKGTM